VDLMLQVFIWSRKWLMVGQIVGVVAWAVIVGRFFVQFWLV
jgi:hypothetical protein